MQLLTLLKKISTVTIYPLILLLIPIEASTGSETFSKKKAYGSIRIENEYKLRIPQELTEKVWAYLIENYLGENSILKKRYSGFETKKSDEFFIDRYFDNSNLSFLKSQSSLRHRTRQITADQLNKKNGRNLIQLKLRRLDDENKLNRNEIKYKVKKDISNPLKASLGHLIKKKHLSLLIKELQILGIEMNSLKEKLTINQRRRRIYIEYTSKPFATITLDEVYAKKLWKECQFSEIEIEINENIYTKATNAQRSSMQKISNLIKDDLLKIFPTVQQDQIPKYNKAYSLLERQSSLFAIFYRYL